MKLNKIILLASAAFLTISASTVAKETPKPLPLNTGIAVTEQQLEPLLPTLFQKKQLRNALDFIQQYHVISKQIDADIVVTAYRRFIHRIDANRIIFNQDEVDAYLAVAQAKFDNVLNGNVGLAFDIFNTARERYVHLAQYAIKRLNEPYDFDSQRYWDIKIEEEDPWLRQDQLASRNDKRLSNDYLSLKVIGTEHQDIIKKLSKRYARIESQWRKRNAEDVIKAFSDSLTEIFDPHTAYLSPRGSKDFDINISLSLTGIGAVLQSDGDFTVIKKLIKGGPAKESNKINAGDRIIGVAQGENGEMVDVVGERLDDVVSQIRGKKGSTVRLQIQERGSTAATKEISIIRDVITLEDRTAKAESTTIKSGDNRVKIGVIEIPTFYTDFEAVRKGKKPKNQTSSDVLRLIENFRADGIEAILIDLRGDGGGPLTEAINLTGLFIDEGPVVQTKGRPDENREIYNDPIKGVAWDGPLAVLVDRNSASASEIFAGAIQDYDRGLILGETTFGKGTVQSLVPLAPILSSEPKEKYGQVKLTTSKFYRISGDSTQNKGVEPDLVIPMPLPNDVTGERSLKYSLPFTQIESANFRAYDYYLSDKNIKSLTQKHKARIESSEKFSWINQTSELFTSFLELSEIPLNESERRLEQEKNDATSLELLNLRRKILGKELLTELEHEDEDDNIGDEEDEDESVIRDDDFVLEEAAHVLADYAAHFQRSIAKNQ